MNRKKILILDYSTDRCEAPALEQWLPTDIDIKIQYICRDEQFPEALYKEEFSHIVHSGSSLSINETYSFTQDALLFIRDMQSRGVAQFGICFGHQLVCRSLVGEKSIRRSPKGLEAGWGNVRFTKEGKTLLSLNEQETVWQSHFDEVTEIPEGSVVLAENSHSEIQAFLNRDKKILCTQFHPEFDKERGNELFKHDRSLLTGQGYVLEEILAGGPSFDTGKVFFNFFLSQL